MQAVEGRAPALPPTASPGVELQRAAGGYRQPLQVPVSPLGPIGIAQERRVLLAAENEAVAVRVACVEGKVHVVGVILVQPCRGDVGVQEISLPGALVAPVEKRRHAGSSEGVDEPSGIGG